MTDHQPPPITRLYIEAADLHERIAQRHRQEADNLNEEARRYDRERHENHAWHLRANAHRHHHQAEEHRHLADYLRPPTECAECGADFTPCFCRINEGEEPTT